MRLNDNYAFVVDGETEVWYLNMLKRNNPKVRITIKPELAKSSSIEEQYQQVCWLAQDFKIVFWIVDTDVIIKEKNEGSDLKYKELCKYFRKLPKNVKFIANTPCLEYWFLLHMKKTSSYYPAYNNKLKRDLKKYDILKNYEKSEKYYTQSNDIYKRLMPYLQDARNNAKALPKFNMKNIEQGICEMYKIFDEMGL
ncbi:MAG: RloB domain-containing protein [Bacteroidaceae bacterium]|nr:RloB domain-containing protein [Bacteroidaceae bacterium]